MALISVSLSDLDAGAPIVSFTATFKALIGSIGNGADGMSFNFASDLPLTGMGEDGGGTGLTIVFDTFANSAGDAPNIEVKVGGAQVASAFFPGLRPGQYVDVVIKLNPNNTLDIIYDGYYGHSNLNLTAFGYAPSSASLFGFAARCGGVTDNHFIDNLTIVTRTNAGAFVQSFAPRGRRVETNSAIDIVLTDSTSQVNTNTIALQLDGAAISAGITTNGAGNTAIHYLPPSGLVPYTTHTVSLSFADNSSPTPQTNLLQYSFTAAPKYVVLFSDGFEKHNSGVAPLDMNYSSTIPNNASANGNLAGNPWFGPAPPNARVLGSEGSVAPHGGTNMIRGSAASDLDENWYNLSYRLHNQIPFSGNIVLDWWFYDPLGSGGTTYREFAAIGYYNTCPNNTDYPGTGSLNGSAQIQRLSLGATSVQSAGFDGTKYQTRVVNASDGYGSGWFNTPVSRSVGWHHGRIAVEGKVVNSAPNLLFYLDDMSNPCFVHNAVLIYSGYNVLELNTAYGTTFGYMDDITFSVAQPPRLTATRAGNNVILTWPGDGFVLMSASDVTGPWTDIPSAASDYSYDTTSNPQQYFRLRN